MAQNGCYKLGQSTGNLSKWFATFPASLPSDIPCGKPAEKVVNQVTIGPYSHNKSEPVAKYSNYGHVIKKLFGWLVLALRTGCKYHLFIFIITLMDFEWVIVKWEYQYLKYGIHFQTLLKLFQLYSISAQINGGGKHW